MSEAVSVEQQVPRVRLRERLRAGARANRPTRQEALLALSSALLLILSFPDFNLWPLAWVALVPLLLAVARRAQSARAFLLGLMMGTLFFFGSCYWLTYAMVRYGRIPVWIAYPLLVPGAFALALFPALCCLLLARMIARRGSSALLLAPVFWAALEWARLGMTGQLWNAVGYSQAYVTPLIQTASWGGVYAVGFLIVAVNASLSYAIIKRTSRAVLTALAIVVCVAVVIFAANSYSAARTSTSSTGSEAIAVAVQPNVPMEPVEDLAETESLVNRHKALSRDALQGWEREGKIDNPGPAAFDDNPAKEDSKPARVATPRLVIWPESPMNFTYANDAAMREWVGRFAVENHSAILFNSLEPAPGGGAYNSAVMINEEGRKVAQYDKIRLLPFGEYVPLPRWLPGVNLVPVMVGDFTPGTDYPLMTIGKDTRLGVFICFESAFPSISRRFADRGADVLINISNDGYLGPTPVMRQHLANAVFRAVENGRPVVRVTNTGISAFITPRGEVIGATDGFKPEVRVWAINRAVGGKTFYTRFGDIFAAVCAALGLLAIATTLRKSKDLVSEE
jgi:apolipoprotein N-acyltransferase